MTISEFLTFVTLNNMVQYSFEENIFTQYKIRRGAKSAIIYHSNDDSFMAYVYQDDIDNDGWSSEVTDIDLMTRLFIE